MDQGGDGVGPTTLLTRFAKELRRAPEAGDFGVNVAMRPAFAGHVTAVAGRAHARLRVDLE